MLKKISTNKKAALDRLSTKDGFIEALAIDQRGALKKMIRALGQEPTAEQISDFKVLVSDELTPYASSILLDPEYGLAAAKARHKDAGLLLAYERTGYDATTPGRLPDLLEDWSVQRLHAEGADAIKFLLYYDVDEDPKINHLKHVFVERVASECLGEDIPFFLEVVTYDAKVEDGKSKEYAKMKPHKVLEAMKEFSKPQYGVDVLKVEVPVNMNYVEGFAKNAEDVVYSRTEALNYFKDQNTATNLPFIFLSAGVSADLFKETLKFAKEAGSTFNGVLCGRATWSDGVKPFAESGEVATREWLVSQGKENITSLNDVVNENATPWYEKLIVED